MAAPDLGGHLTDDAQWQEVVSALLSTAASRLDRLVLLDVPADHAGNTLAPADALAVGRDHAASRTRSSGAPGRSTTRGCWCRTHSAG